MYGRSALLAVLAAVSVSCGDPPSSPPDDTTLAAPTESAALELASGDIRVTWRDNSDNEVRFELLRSSAGPSGTYAALASVGANASSYDDAQVDGVSDYCYQVRAVGASGTSPSPYTSPVCHQSVPPAQPTDLTAAPAPAQVNLSWSDDSDTEAGFEVWRSATGPQGTFVLVGTVDADATSFGDTGLADATEYCYRVRAIGAKGQPSVFTAVACATTPVPTLPPPAAPSGLSATLSGAASVALAWTDNASNETGLELWRSTSGASGTYTLLLELQANVESAGDAGLTAGTEYCYKVRALGRETAPPSAFSNAECATAPTPPAAPTNLNVSPISPSRVDLSWIDEATDEADYQVWRSTDGISGTYTRLETLPADAQSYSDRGLTSDTEYCYKVRATGAGFAPNSPFSAAACAITPVPLVVRIVLFGDSNTDHCEETPSASRLSSYVSVAPRLAPDDPPLSCSVAGKVEAAWEAERSERIRVVNHGIASTTTGGNSGAPGDPARSSQGSPNARLKVGAFTRFEAEVLGRGRPWSGGEPTNSSFPTGPIDRVNAFSPGANDFVYVSMGTNDDATTANQTRTLTAAETAANLRWMIDQWTGAGHAADHFILTTLAPRSGANSPTSIPDRNELIRDLANETSIHLVDLAGFTSNDDGATWKSASLHIGDGVHYTEAVREWIGQQVADWMSAEAPGFP